ncbi:MAG TPA: hypothetical protein VN455_10105 [Methanotrichaceae archaeon]|nr:hypothetical protein [Methanotrichaceae archaeon]
MNSSTALDRSQSDDNQSIEDDKIEDENQSDGNGSLTQPVQEANLSASDWESLRENVTSERESESPKTKEVAAYVYNDDDDTLDVSLYIDSVPRGKVDVDKGSEETFGNYTLTTGPHRFKILWKDSDTNKVYESEIKKDVSDDDLVRLYTSEHQEPQEFNLLVSVKNENDKETKAYLYIDGKFEKSQDLAEQSISEFDEVSVDEGIHDVSLRWLDPGTDAEYEKKKSITVDDDKAVIFVVTKGISFEEDGLAASAPEADPNAASNEGISENNENAMDTSSSTDTGSNTDINSSTDVNSSIDTKADLSDTSSIDTTSTDITKSAEGKNEESGSSLLALKIEGTSDTGEPDTAKADIGIYPAVYLAVLLIAIYLVFRR